LHVNGRSIGAFDVDSPLDIDGLFWYWSAQSRNRTPQHHEFIMHPNLRFGQLISTDWLTFGQVLATDVIEVQVSGYFVGRRTMFHQVIQEVQSTWTRSTFFLVIEGNEARWMYSEDSIFRPTATGVRFIPNE
jgi:hypothetical protein